MKLNWTLLFTDYSNFMINYHCDNLPDGKSLQTAWMAARTTKLNETSRKETEILIEKYFFSAAMFAVYQGDDFCMPRLF